MADVFISYKRRLRPVVERLADALRAHGLTVWFDARLEPGDSFSDEIAREVRNAGCVLVAWSNDAFPHGGDTQAWVRGEATIGRERGVLVSVQMEPTDFDPPWNMMHHENLIGWATAKGLGPSDDPRWQSVLAAVGAKLGKTLDAAPPTETATSAMPTAQRGPSSALVVSVGGLLLLAAIGAAAYFTSGSDDGPKQSAPQQSAFASTMLQYCAETPSTVTYDCACMARVMERELDPTSQAIFLIVGKPGASGDPQTVDRLLRDAGYTQAEIDAANRAVPLAVAKVKAECAPLKPAAQP